jgi:hypothetical protein
MTTGTPLEQVPADLRGWTMRQLDLEADATAADVRGTFVQHLADEDFVPPWRWQQAFGVVHQPGQTACERVLRYGQLHQDEEERLREEVRAFAGAFFTLDCAERRRRWKALRDQCDFYPVLTAWLNDLEPGLAVVPETENEKRASQLGDHICTLFVLPRARRAHQRRELLLEMKADLPLWEDAARQLYLSQPALRELEPVLIRQVFTWRERIRNQVRAARRRATATGTSSSSNSRLPVSGWLVFVVVLGILRGLSSTSSQSPKYTVPKSEPVPWERIYLDMMEKEKNRSGPLPSPTPTMTPEEILKKALEKRWPVENPGKAKPDGPPDNSPVSSKPARP